MHLCIQPRQSVRIIEVGLYAVERLFGFSRHTFSGSSSLVDPEFPTPTKSYTCTVLPKGESLVTDDDFDREAIRGRTYLYAQNSTSH